MGRVATHAKTIKIGKEPAQVQTGICWVELQPQCQIYELGMKCRTGLPTVLEVPSDQQVTRYCYLPGNVFPPPLSAESLSLHHQYSVECHLGQTPINTIDARETPESPTTRRKPADTPDSTMDASYKACHSYASKQKLNEHRQRGKYDAGREDRFMVGPQSHSVHRKVAILAI